GGNDDGGSHGVETIVDPGARVEARRRPLAGACGCVIKPLSMLLRTLAGRVVLVCLAVVVSGCPTVARKGPRPATAESAAGVVADTGNAIDLPRALVAHCDTAQKLVPTDDPYARFEECAK